MNPKSSLENIFPIEFIEDNKTITKNGSISVGFELVELAHRDSISEDGYLGIHYLFTAALQTLAPGTFIHKMDVFFQESYHPTDFEEEYFQQKKRNYFLARPILKHRSFFFIGFSEPHKKFNAGQTFFSRGKKRFPDMLTGIGEKLEMVEKLGSQISSLLSSMDGMRMKRMDNKALNDFFHQYLNLDFSKTNTIHKPIINHVKSCLVGNEHLNIISMVGQGSEVVTSSLVTNGVQGSFIEPLLSDLSFPHIVNQCLQISDTDKELGKLDNLRNLVNSFTGFRDQAGELHELGLGELSKEIRQSGGSLVRFHLNVMIYDADISKQHQKIDQVLAQTSALGGLKLMVENLDTCNLFFSMVGGNLNENFRWILMPSKNASCYFSFTGTHRGDAGGMLLCNRNREPIHINFWNDALENKNKIVVGPSGSGKSFVINTLITQHYADREQVIILDIGGSYKGLFKAIQGKYIDYKVSGGLNFNPFTISVKEDFLYYPTQEKLNFLVTLLSILWKGETYQLSKIEKSLLGRLVNDYYHFVNEGLTNRKGQSSLSIPSMNGFYDFVHSIIYQGNIHKEYLLSIEYLDIKSLLIVLFDFSKNGMFRNLLNSEDPNMLSDNQLICFDLQGIKEDTTLFPIVSLLIIELVLDKIRDAPTSRKNIYMDEAWSMLKEALGDFVMNMFRTIRKSNGAITIITQGIDEIERSPVGKAILQNAATKVILDHSSATQFYPMLQTSLGLTEHEMKLLKSLRRNDEQGWREIFVKFGSTSMVFILEPSPEERVAFDSRIETRTKLSNYLEKYDANLALAIDQINEEMK